MELLAQLHPPVVHFAIALIITGILFDVLGFILKKESLKHAGFWTILFGIFAVWGAMFTGHEAEELVEDAIKGTVAYQLLEEHDEIGEILPWIVTVLGIMRMFLFFRPNNKLFVIYLIAGLLVAGAIGYQGRTGGKLVFEYGVGVKTVNKEGEKKQDYYHYEDEHE